MYVLRTKLMNLTFIIRKIFTIDQVTLLSDDTSEF